MNKNQMECYPIKVILTEINNATLTLNHCNIILLLKGSILVNNQNKSFILNETDVIYVLPGTQCISQNENFNLTMIFEIDETLLEDIFDDIGKVSFNSSMYENKNYVQLRSLLANIANNYYSKEENSYLLYYSFVYRLLYLLSLEFKKNYKLHTYIGSDKYEERILQIKRYIRQNYRHSLTIQDLANHLFLTPQYLSKFMKNQMGINFVDYLNNIRLHNSVTEMLSSDYTITQISFDHGFPNMTAFNRVFKRLYGQNPKQFRDQHKIIQKKTFSEIKQIDFHVAKKSLQNLIINDFEENIDEDKKHIDIVVNSADYQDLNPIWSSMINLGFASDIMNYDFQQQLTSVQNQLRFKYARVEGMFDTVIIDRIPNTNIYNYSNSNKILDFLKSLKLTPFLELALKPKKFNINTKGYIHFNQDTRQLTTEEWDGFLHGFLNNCINRYGYKQVEKWKFEFWIPHDSHLEFTKDALTEYIKRFSLLHRIVKSLLPNAEIGGPGYNMSANEIMLTQILTELRLEHISLDFLSICSFHIEVLHDHPNQIPSFTTNTKYLSQKLQHIKSILKTHKYDCPIILSQWNFDYTSRNYLNDSIFKAAFVVKNVLDNMNVIDTIGYWLLSDLTTDYKDANQILFGGNGLVSVNGLLKPVYYAYEILSILGDKIVDRGDGYIVTTNAPGDYQILLYNYCHPLDFYCFKCDTEITKNNIHDIFSGQKSLSVDLTINKLQKSLYRIKKIAINESHGSVLDQWNLMANVDEFSPSEIVLLNNMSAPIMEIHTQEVNTNLKITAKLSVNEICIFIVNQML